MCRSLLEDAALELSTGGSPSGVWRSCGASVPVLRCAFVGKACFELFIPGACFGFPWCSWLACDQHWSVPGGGWLLVASPACAERAGRRACSLARPWVGPGPTLLLIGLAPCWGVGFVMAAPAVRASIYCFLGSLLVWVWCSCCKLGSAPCFLSPCWRY